MRKSSVFLSLAVSIVIVTVPATEYMSREQLNSAVVYDLPGVLPPDYRERDAEYMTMNAFSRASDTLAEHGTLTLGLVGGIGALGLAGILSAPVAIIAAAAVGGFALVGAMSDDSRRASVKGGRAASNFGTYGTGGAPIVGASRDVREQGLLGQIFGISNDRGEYGVGSIGLSSSQRAPVHVNMQNPHVMNVANRGYNFAGYDQNYHTGFSNQYGMMNPNMVSPYGIGMQNTMLHPQGQYFSSPAPVIRDSAVGLPFAPGSSQKVENPSAPISQHNYFVDGTGFATTQTRVTYIPPQGQQQNPYGYGMPQTQMNFPGSMPMGMGGMPYQGIPPMMAYGMQMVGPQYFGYTPPQQTQEQFTNFFERTTPAGSAVGTRGTRNDPSNPYPYWAQPQYNWQAAIGRPENLLATSGEYQGAGSWNQMSPQGRINQPVQQYDLAPTAQYSAGQAYPNQYLPTGYDTYALSSNQNQSMPYGYQYGNYAMPPQVGLGVVYQNQVAQPQNVQVTNQTDTAAKRARLEQERRDVYAQLTQAMQSGDAEARQRLTEAYNRLNQEIEALR